MGQHPCVSGKAQLSSWGRLPVWRKTDSIHQYYIQVSQYYLLCSLKYAFFRTEAATFYTATQSKTSAYTEPNATHISFTLTYSALASLPGPALA